ncbi:MAG: GAF domain-containing protein [Deltaproteobacteria bacterium]|nr:GAF domain-containing protein [Deltaproteobacteria bacterium]
MDEKEQITNLNETIAAKFSRIETTISSSQDIQELFENLVNAMTEEFAIPYIWFSFIHSRRAVELVKRLESSDLLKERLNMILASAFADLIKNGQEPVLANHELKPFFKLLPKSNKYFLKSLAVAPIVLKGNVIGSLNYGDSTAQRYSPDMDTTLLQNLAEKFSSLLSKILANEKIESSVDEEQSEM